MLVNCVAYQEGKKLSDIPVEAISDYLVKPDCFVWVALRDPGTDEIKQMQQEFGLHELAVEDAVRGNQRPKIEEYGDSLFLQTLVDRLLAPHRRPHIVGDVNIHEVCERVRSLMLAEFPAGLTIRRDYDASIPEFRGDKEQLIQTVLNIARNAAQALSERIEAGDAELIFRTRVARQVTLAKVRYALALDLHITDNGPGISPQIRDRIFYPLVSGREGGSGLGLTLAQTFVQQHLGVIECESRPGLTAFRILLPLP